MVFRRIINLKMMPIFVQLAVFALVLSSWCMSMAFPRRIAYSYLFATIVDVPPTKFGRPIGYFKGLRKFVLGVNHGELELFSDCEWQHSLGHPWHSPTDVPHWSMETIDLEDLGSNLTLPKFQWDPSNDNRPPEASSDGTWSRRLTFPFWIVALPAVLWLFAAVWRYWSRAIQQRLGFWPTLSVPSAEVPRTAADQAERQQTLEKSEEHLAPKSVRPIPRE